MGAFRDFMERDGLSGFMPQMIRKTIKSNFDIQKQYEPRIRQDGKTRLGSSIDRLNVVKPPVPASLHPKTIKSKLK